MTALFRRVFSYCRYPRVGLATVLAVSFGTLGLCLTGGLAFIVDRAATQQIHGDIEREVAGLASQMREQLDQGMFERWRDIQVAASLDTIRDAGLSVNLKRSVLAKLQGTYPDYAIVALVSPEGRVVATSNGVVEGIDVSTREYFINGRLAPYVGDVHDALILAKLLPQVDGEPPRFLDVAAPIARPDGTFGGVLVAHLYWEWAQNVSRSVLKLIKKDAGTEIFVIGKDGTVLLGPPSLQGRHLDLTSIAKAQAGGLGAIQEQWPDGVYLTGFDRSAGYRDYPGLGWTVLVRENLNAALAPARELRSQIIKASLLASFLTVLSGIVIARRVTQPLRRLTTAADAAQHTLMFRFPPARGYAEVADLSRSLVSLFDERIVREETIRKAHDDARMRETEALANEASFRLLFSTNPVPMFVFSLETLKFQAANEAALGFYGVIEGEFLTMTLLDIRPIEEHPRILETVQTFGEVGAYDAERAWRHLRRDGTERQVLTSVRRLTYEGELSGLVAVIDITDRLHAEAELRGTKKFLDAIVESMPAMLVVKDARDHRFVLVNKAAEELLGIPRAEMLGKTDYDVFPRDQAQSFAECDREVLRSSETLIIPEEPIQTRGMGLRLLTTKKLAIRDKDGEPQFLLIMSDDVTERRAAEARITHMAHYDSLTELPNRSLFHEHLASAFRRVRADAHQRFAVVYLDLDDFKNVNDTLGHSLGDELLQIVAQRLRSCTREGDLVARLGGDEFGIIQTVPLEDDTMRAVSALAMRILSALKTPFVIFGNQVSIGTSIGIAVAPDDGSEPEQLMKSADMALYRVKAEGRGNYRYFEPEMNAKIQTRRAMEADLREALLKNQFEIYYQPLIRISTNQIIGVEALLRWRHPIQGMVSPADFIPLAEETRLIIPIGEWVLHQACAEVASWPGDLRVAVNLSSVQFKNANVPEVVARALALSGLSASRLEAEITETILLQEDGKTLAALNELRAMGVKISMDDFGTGYSSLSYLQKYPFDKIKIDQSFVKDISCTAESQAIIRAAIGLATTLGMSTTAEGVETEDQLTLLRAAGCQEAQGYLISRPKPAAEIRALLEHKESFSKGRSDDSRAGMIVRHFA
jgi:diguanylate cyclase (GGDEF)-like protein/PAS domain S-box-containing protein